MDLLGSTLSTLTPFLTANFLPRFLASSLIRFLDQASHNTPLQALWKPARPGTREHASNWKRALSIVLISYFIYNSHASYTTLTSRSSSDTPYAILGVPIGVTDSGLKSASRQMALAYHPDRRPGDRAAEALFVAGREAGDLLGDKVLRNGYDRFGPSLISALRADSNAAPASSKTAQIHTTREVYHLGLLRMGWWWVQMIGMQLGLGVLMQGGIGFPKVFILLLAFLTELSIILRPSSSFIPAMTTYLLPHLLPFQAISLIHSLAISSLITVPQLLALWVPADASTARPETQEEEDASRNQLAVVLKEMRGIIRGQEIRTWMGLNDMVASVREAGKAQGLPIDEILRQELEEVMIDRAFKENASTAALWDQALARHKAA